MPVTDGLVMAVRCLGGGKGRRCCTAKSYNRIESWTVQVSSQKMN